MWNILNGLMFVKETLETLFLKQKKHVSVKYAQKRLTKASKQANCLGLLQKNIYIPKQCIVLW